MSRPEARPFADLFHRKDPWLGSLIRNNPLATIVVDSSYGVQMCNAAFETLFGYREAEIIGQPVDDLITGPDSVREAREFNRRATAGEAVRAVTRRRRKDGSLVDVEVDIVPLMIDGAPLGAYGIYRDLTAEKRAERLLAAQYAVVQALAESEKVEEAAPRILRAVGQQVGFQFGVLFVSEGRTGRLRCVDAWHDPEVDLTEFERATRATAFARGEGFAGRIWATARPGWIVDVTKDPSFPGAQVAARAGLHAAFGFPILSGTDAFGVVEFFSTSVLEPDEPVIRMFAAIGNQLGAFIARRRAQRDIERFFAMSRDMLCIAGFDGYFKRLNASWERELGFTLAELETKPLLEFVHPEDRDAMSVAFARPADGGLTLETRWLCRDGSHKWLHWSVIVAPEQRIVYGVARDITDRRAAEQQMQEALKMKSDFVSFVTHQLRTPLSGIKWMLELAREAEDRTEVESYVQDARESAERLITLVNDLLDVSRLESGKLQVSLQPTDVRALTKGVLDEVAGLVREKHHKLVVEAAAVPEVVVDAQLLRQAILNLVSNAIKYTPANGRIDVRIVDAHGALNWSIHDSGIGIPAAAQAKLFEKFYRADNALTVDTEGTGLGLYLVRLIVERFGGKVMCESTEGQGTTFSIALPLAEATVT
jgi:PAS domain S-box-containing protein